MYRTEFATILLYGIIIFFKEQIKKMEHGGDLLSYEDYYAGKLVDLVAI